MILRYLWFSSEVTNDKSCILFFEEWKNEIVHHCFHFVRNTGHNDEEFAVAFEEISRCSAKPILYDCAIAGNKCLIFIDFRSGNLRWAKIFFTFSSASSLRTRSVLKNLQTTARVMSSCVGPSPPVTVTTSCVVHCFLECVKNFVLIIAHRCHPIGIDTDGIQLFSDDMPDWN